MEGKSHQTQAEAAPQAGPSLHYPKSHTALQPGRHGRIRCSQVREGGQGLPEAWGQRSLAGPERWRSVAYSQGSENGLGRGASAI